MQPIALHLVLVAPEIHWNTGNAGRTALALGATLHLVGPLGFSLDDKHVRRAGLDYWDRVDLRTWRDWSHVSTELPKLGEPLFFSARATKSYCEVDYPASTVLVFGCESVGLPDALVQAFPDRQLGIPMQKDSVRSLNLSTAVAVAAYEVVRQRHLQNSHAHQHAGPH